MLSILHQLCFRSFSCPNRLIFKPIFLRLLAYSSRINLSFTTQVLVTSNGSTNSPSSLEIGSSSHNPCLHSLQHHCSSSVSPTTQSSLPSLVSQSEPQNLPFEPQNLTNLIIHFSQLLLHLQNHFLNVYLLLSLLFQLMSCMLVQNLVFSKQKLILPPFLCVNQILWSHHL